MNELPYTMLKDDGAPLDQRSAGLLSTMTPAGGAALRHYADVANAATVGTIEIGTTFNVAVDVATGTWAGRDVAGECWLEKWTDTGAVKEYWYAPTAAAGVVPSWTLKYKMDLLNGIPQFDATTRLATMAAVRKELGSFSSAVSVSTNTTLTEANAGKLIMMWGSASITLTLPLASTVPLGTVYTFSSVMTGGNIATISRAGADTISSGQSIVNSLPVNVGDNLILVSTGSTGWWAVGGSAQLIHSEGVFKVSFAAGGYQKLPSGLIIQWGVVTNNVTAGNATAVTFPISFPTACIHVYQTANSTGTAVAAAWFDTITATGFNSRANISSMASRYLAVGY